MQKERPSRESSGNIFYYPSPTTWPRRGGDRGLHGGIGRKINRDYVEGGDPKAGLGGYSAYIGPEVFSSNYSFRGPGVIDLAALPVNPYSYIPVLSDADIEDHIESLIRSDPIIDMEDRNNIFVEVRNSIVTLYGEVKKRRSKFAAFNDSFWQPGVVDVINNIKII